MDDASKIAPEPVSEPLSPGSGASSPPAEDELRAIVRRGRPARLSAADLATILKLHKQGQSARAIATQLDRSPSATAKAIRDGQRRATRAAVREGQDGLVQDARRRRDAERQRRKRERDKAAERAREVERAGQTAEERRKTAARPTGGMQGEPEFERPKVMILQETVAGRPGTLTDTLGSDMRYFAPRTSARRRSGSGFAAYLDRQDAAREDREQAAERAQRLGLELSGLAVVRVLDADGAVVLQATYDPLSSGDLKRAADLTGLDIVLLSRAAHDPRTVRELAAGVRPPAPEPDSKMPDGNLEPEPVSDEVVEDEPKSVVPVQRDPGRPLFTEADLHRTGDV